MRPTDQEMIAVKRQLVTHSSQEKGVCHTKKGGKTGKHQGQSGMGLEGQGWISWGRVQSEMCEVGRACLRLVSLDNFINSRLWGIQVVSGYLVPSPRSYQVRELVALSVRAQQRKWQRYGLWIFSLYLEGKLSGQQFSLSNASCGRGFLTMVCKTPVIV